MAGIGADEQRAQTLGVEHPARQDRRLRDHRAFAGAVGAAMSVRWTYIDPATVFNPFIGFQTVLIALIGGAATLWGPLLAAVVFSLLAETLRLQLPQVYMMSLGLLLILCVLYLPGGWPRCWPLARRRRRAMRRPSPLLEARERQRPLRRADGAVDARQRRLRAGRAGRHHRPERRRQDDLLQRHLGRRCADPGALLARGERLTGAAAAPLRASTASPAPSRRRASSPPCACAANVDFGLQFAGRAAPRGAGAAGRDAASILDLIGLDAQAAAAGRARSRRRSSGCSRSAWRWRRGRAAAARRGRRRPDRERGRGDGAADPPPARRARPDRHLDRARGDDAAAPRRARDRAAPGPQDRRRPAGARWCATRRSSRPTSATRWRAASAVSRDAGPRRDQCARLAPATAASWSCAI